MGNPKLSIRNRIRMGLAKALSPKARKSLRFAYARTFDILGIDYFPAHNQLDRKLLRYVGDKRNGVFIEAGANDGLAQSNTWHLEKRLGWTGLLVEPIPEFAALCRKFRPRSKVANSALGSFEQEGSTVTLHYGALMTAVEGADSAHMHGGSVDSHAREGAAWVGDESYTFTATVATLTALALEAGFTAIDLLSLDVEGFEINVLNGIDFARLPIRRILIETSNVDAVSAVLGSRYRLVDRLSPHDYLFEARAIDE